MPVFEIQQFLCHIRIKIGYTGNRHYRPLVSCCNGGYVYAYFALRLFCTSFIISFTS